MYSGYLLLLGLVILLGSNADAQLFSLFGKGCDVDCSASATGKAQVKTVPLYCTLFSRQIMCKNGTDISLTKEELEGVKQWIKDMKTSTAAPTSTQSTSSSSSEKTKVENENGNAGGGGSEG